MSKSKTPKYLIECVKRIRRIEWLMDQGVDHSSSEEKICLNTGPM